MNIIAKQTKHGMKKAVMFTIDQSNHGQKKKAMEMYSTHKKGKSIVNERFIRTLKNKICKHMTSITKI